MRTLVIGTVLFAAVTATVASEGEEPYRAAQTLEQQSRSSLGVGIRALSFLFDATPESILLKDAIIEDGAWKELELLQQQGFITIETINTGSGEFVRLNPTAKGASVKKAFQ